MKTVAQILILTLVLVAVYLLVAGSPVFYRAAITQASDVFSRLWKALTQGKE